MEVSVGMSADVAGWIVKLLNNCAWIFGFPRQQKRDETGSHKGHDREGVMVIERIRCLSSSLRPEGVLFSFLKRRDVIPKAFSIPSGVCYSNV